MCCSSLTSSHVERTVDSGYNDTPSIRDERVETIGANIQERYRRVLDERNVEYDCIIEEGDARQVRVELPSPTMEHQCLPVVAAEATAAAVVCHKLRS